MKGFKRYERYKDSGVEWIGEIPEKWEVKPLKRITCFISRGITPTYVDDSSVKVINQACIYWEKLNLDNIKYQKEDSKISKGRLYKGDLIINSTGTGTLGRAAIFNLEGSYIADTHVTIIRSDKESLNNKYLFYLLQTPKYQGYIYSALVTGATNQIELSREGLSKTSIIYPKIEEQQAIVNFLDQKTAEIDFLIADNEKLIELLQEQRQAIITQAVTKGLDPNVPMKDSGIEWVGEIPEHWEVVPLFKAFSEHQHKNTNNKEDNVLSLSYGKIIRRNIETNYGLLPESFETYNVVQPGFIVLRLTDLQNDKHSLRCGLVKEKGIITSAYVTIKKRCNDVNPSYFYYLLHGYDLLKVFYNMGGGVRQSLKYNELKRMPIVVPNECEQKTIAEFLDKKTSELDNLILEMKLQIEKLREYRQSLITAAVTGKIDVRDYIVDNDKEEGEEQEEVS